MGRRGDPGGDPFLSGNTMRPVVAFLLLAATVHATDPQVHRDLPYAGTEHERQALDLYTPAEGEGHPVVLWIHGGGWQAGDKADVQAKPEAFVDRGFVFVSAGYRLLPEVTIGEMAGDLAKALRWVHDHAGEYGGDPDTIFVMGHSAGAQLAALLPSPRSSAALEGGHACSRTTPPDDFALGFAPQVNPLLRPEISASRCPDGHRPPPAVDGPWPTSEGVGPLPASASGRRGLRY